MPILGMFGNGMRTAAQQTQPRSSMGGITSAMAAARPLFGGSAPQARPQIPPPPPPPQAKPPSMWDGIAQDPLAFFFTGPNGVMKRQNADAAQQAAAAQRQARIEQANALGMKGREAALFVDANEDYYKNYAENMKPQTGTFYDTGTNKWNQKPQDLMSLAEGTDVYDPNKRESVYSNDPAVKPSEGFSLKPGEVYFDANGKRVASVAPLPREGTDKPTPMQTAVDKNWADDLVNWQINGAANFGKQMMQLDGAVARLKSGEELTGPGTTFLPGPMRDLFGQAGKDVQQQIQEIVQGSLREVLGAQFTQKEGEGIMARTFDPTLEEGVNAQRAERLVAQLKLAAQQKNAALEYYNQNGTMNGYQGKVPSVADFNAAIDGGSVGGDGSITAPNGQTFTREKSVAVQNFMKSLPKSMQDPQFMAQLDNLLGQSSSPAQQAAPPSGVSREEWNAMTPEEKALFQ